MDKQEIIEEVGKTYNRVPPQAQIVQIKLLNHD